MKPQLSLRTYKTVESALKAAGDRPFLRVGNAYLVPDDPNSTYVLGALQVEILCGGHYNSSPSGLLRGGSVRVSSIDEASTSYRLPAEDAT